MPIYALSRINDISWGTKGLDSAGGKDVTHLQESWKQIRIISVAKFTFWNIFFGMIFLSLGSATNTRFFITFAIMILLGVTLLLKTVLAIVYLLFFRFKQNVPEPALNWDLPDSLVDQVYYKLKNALLSDIY